MPGTVSGILSLNNRLNDSELKLIYKSFVALGLHFVLVCIIIFY